MRRALLDGLFALLFGIAASFAWWFAFVFGFAAVGNEAVAVFVIGIPIAAFFGVIAGIVRGPSASIPAMCVGWVLSLVTTPETLTLANPANKTASDRLAPALLLAAFAAIGILGIVTGRSYSRDNSNKRLTALAVLTIALTSALATAMILWK